MACRRCNQCAITGPFYRAAGRAGLFVTPRREGEGEGGGVTVTGGTLELRAVIGAAPVTLVDADVVAIFVAKSEEEDRFWTKRHEWHSNSDAFTSLTIQPA